MHEIFYLDHQRDKTFVSALIPEAIELQGDEKLWVQRGDWAWALKTLLLSSSKDAQKEALFTL